MAMPRFAPVVVLILGGIVLMLNLGVRSSFGLFVEGDAAGGGMRDAFAAAGQGAGAAAWSMTTFGLAFAIQNLMWGIMAPLGGMIADRFGTARTIAFGLAVYGIGWGLMALSDVPLLFHLTAGIVVGIGSGLTSFSLVLGAIGRAYPAEKRSMALGIAAALGSFGQVALAPLAQVLIADLGWFDTAMVLAAGLLGSMPLAIALTGNATTGVAGAPLMTMGQAVREAFGQRSYLLLALGFFVCGFHIAFILGHLPTFISMCGLPAGVSGSALALVGLFNIVGTLLVGWLGGRYPKKYLLSGIYFLRAAVILGFLFAPKTEATVLIFAGTMGLLWLSTVPATSGLVAHIFGPAYMASLFGFVMLSHQVGAFFGSWLGGVVLDATQSYDLMWQISAALGVFAGLVNLPIREVSLRLAPPRPAAAA